MVVIDSGTSKIRGLKMPWGFSTGTRVPSNSKPSARTDGYVAAMRAYNAGEGARRMRSWNLPFLIRHSAYHNLDHAWEMED